jgi:hypothetical protein
MAAKAKPKPDEPPGPALDELRVGLAVCPLVRRQYQPHPARYVSGAAGDAEEAAGGPGDLVVLAVDPAELDAILARLDGMFDVARVRPPE